MGIPKLAAWLNNKRDVYKREPDEKCLSLSIDMNGILHPLGHKAYKEVAESLDEDRQVGIEQHTEVYMELIKKQITDLVMRFKPQEYLYLAVDGVAPVAKMNQQRSRRFNREMEENIKIKEETVQEGETSSKGSFDSAQLSPGTKLMDTISETIIEWINDNKNEDFTPTNIIYSSHRVFGEGEHKIMDFYRANSTNLNSMEKMYHIIYALDMDVLLLSSASPVTNILIWRESNYTDNGIIVEAFRNSIGKEYIKDFIFVMSLLGNDFLPHHPALQNFETSIPSMIEALKQTRADPRVNSSIIYSHTSKDEYGIDFTTDSLNPEVFFIWLYKMMLKEPLAIYKESMKDYEFPYKGFQVLDKSVKADSLPFYNFRQYWYSDIFNVQDIEVLKKYLKSGKYGEFSDSFIKQTIEEVESNIVSSEDIKTLVSKTIEGMIWVYYYYIHGIKYVNTFWQYPYHHLPLFSELMIGYKMNLDYKTIIDNTLINNRGQEIDIMQALITILPIGARKYLPTPKGCKNALIDLADPKRKSELGHLYPKEFKFVVEGLKARDAFKGFPMLPFVDPYEIEKVIGSLGCEKSKTDNVIQ